MPSARFECRRLDLAKCYEEHDEEQQWLQYLYEVNDIMSCLGR